MTNKVRPIRPNEIDSEKIKTFPDAVFEAFNELIVRDFVNGSARVKHYEVVELMMKKGLNRDEIFGRGWLDIEDVYHKAGWRVEYDRPGYNETYPATFTFERRSKKVDD